MTTIQPERVQYIFDNMLSHMKIEMNIVVQIAHMRDDVVLVYFASKPGLGTKFFAFPLFMR